MFRHMFSSLSDTISPYRCSLAPQIQVRWRWHKDKVENRKINRFGMVDKMKRYGPLPRLQNDSAKLPGPEYIPKNSWVEHRALAGQNDYIDILGNENIHPKQVMYNIPKYLHESHKKDKWVHMAIRRRNYLEHTPFPKLYPRKWESWCKEIARSCNFMNKHTDQNWWINYKGIKDGPVKNPFLPKRF
eukprot:TRINITY_DN80080_c0_g1_i1.p1 TRINITY_DN80080_c0_g1~~TRINITY_DN80080_c0_g1_i1.p1  ORF type:complete len:194 (-),score=23.63 TRINITY_DN80080_c0_g1_i1:70-630(-)